MYVWILKTLAVFLALGLIGCAGMWIIATAATIATDISVPLGLGVLLTGIGACSMTLAGLLSLLYRDKTCTSDSSDSSE
jgi:hypothetical protein